MASATSSKRPTAPPSALTTWQRSGLVVGLIVFALPWILQAVGQPLPGLAPEGHRVLAIFLLAIVLWVTEAVPLHATATIIILLEVLLLSDKAILSAPAGFTPDSYSRYFGCLADPILMLFLGGFFLADGARKFDLDRNLARVMLRPFGTSPRMILLGLMAITALFSMFMSNTATTATMMAVVLPVISQLPAGDRLRAGLALSIPVAANIGGIGTPIGTPPNAIALGALAEAGIHVGFARWMIMAIPFVVVILLLAWVLLAKLFPSRESAIQLNIESTFDRSRGAWIFYLTFAVTVVLWLTEKLHGMSSSVVGFLPVVVLLSTRVFSTRDMQNLQWHVLWLLAGGIALGAGVKAGGLDHWLIGLVSWEHLSPQILIFMLALVALSIGTLISHSATANLLVPIGMSLATSDAVSISPVLAGVFIAVGCSLAMALPVSTPPNAIAMATGAIKTRDMAIVGLVLGAVGLALFVFVGPTLWRLLGVMPS
jgi:sodium-dependent dicarboxylate transporter 2/3/5